MKQMLLEMSEVSRCKVLHCAYNRDELCHARAITVGDGAGPRCDTFVRGSHHSLRQQVAGVGACKSTACKHNTGLQCQAGGIKVGLTDTEPTCMTYAEE